jgi:hypothetical protein
MSHPPAAGERLLRQPAASSSLILGVFVGHLALGYLAARFDAMVLIHAVVCLLLVAVACLRGSSVWRLHLAAYVAGVEVFWRMGKVGLPWETAKYACIALFVSEVLQFGWRSRRSVIFLFALAPGAIICLINPAFTFAVVRDQLVFNLLGPIAMCLAAAAYSRRTLGMESLIAAVRMVCMGALATSGFVLARAGDYQGITFFDESNPTASGGFGPNQVSAILGLGFLLLVIQIVVASKRFTLLSSFLLAASGLILTQAIFTFSRGGVALALAAACAFVALWFTDESRLLRAVVPVLAVVIILTYGVVPFVESIGEGIVAQRYSDIHTTGRAELLGQDLAIWRTAPITGVGVGGAKQLHELGLVNPASHTEYTRILAEHGIIGALGALIFFWGVIRDSLRRSSWRPVGLTVLFWGLMFLSGYGFRIVAPAVLVALALIRTPAGYAPSRAPRVTER